MSILALLTALQISIHCDKSTGPLGNDSPLTIVTPNGGNTYHVGDSMKMSWNLKGDISGLVIDFSADNGRQFFTLVYFVPSSEIFQKREYLWVIPDSIYSFSKASIVSDSCLVWIHGYFDYAFGDKSDKLFSIRGKE
jgi:hypothetical protein